MTFVYRQRTNEEMEARLKQSEEDDDPEVVLKFPPERIIRRPRGAVEVPKYPSGYPPGHTPDPADDTSASNVADPRPGPIGEWDSLWQDGDGTSAADADAGAAKHGADDAPINIGDYVQWVNQGQEQFKTPRRVVWISDDGTHARVEGEDSMAGLPVAQLIPCDAHEPPSDQRGDSETAAVHELRRECWNRGYRPVAVYSPGARHSDGTLVDNPGKRPVGADWARRALRDPPEAVTSQPWSQALNTGLLTGEVSPCDVDVLVPGVTEAIVGLIERTLGPTPLHRIGRAPKRLLCYRAEEPFRKLSTAAYRMPDGTKAKLEILGQGQQFVAFGMHPDTGEPYRWPDGSPETVALAELPTISALEACDLIGEADRILHAAGGIVIKQEESSREQPPGAGDQPGHASFFRAVNTAALANIQAWATALHSGFRDRGNSGWRLSSAALGRSLQEDISVHPDGVWDFGTEEPLTAIDLVIRLGGAADAREAALWLCQRLGIRPESLGWRGPTDEGQQQRYDNGHDRNEQRQRQEYDQARSATICPLIWQGQRVPEQDFVIDEWLPAERVTGFFGGSGYGKTNLAHQLQTAMAIKHEWLGLETNWATSLAVYCEDDEKELLRRQSFINQHYGCDMAALGHMHMKPRLGYDNLLVTFTQEGKPEPTPFYHLLLEEALDLKVKLIIIDTIADVYGGNENNRAQVRAFGQMVMGGLARATGAAVLLVGRPSLSGQAEGRSGSTEWGGVFRAGWFLNRPIEDDPDRRELIRNRATYASHGKHTAIPLRWHNGLFVPDTDETLRRRSCEDTFLLLLDTFWRRDRPLSESPYAARLYAPKVFAGLPRVERAGYRQSEFTAAMELLRFKEYIKASKQDPNTGEQWRSPRLVRIKQGWFED